MKLIIGLGNPGKEYQNTRHNVGFMALDLLKEKYNASFKLETKMEGELSILNLSEKVILLKPTTYMNLSGNAVSKVMNYYKLEAKDIFVIHDDMDLPVGHLRIRGHGSAGGHNGIKSIIEHVGLTFNRAKIGISKGNDAKDYVLGNFSKTEMVDIDIALHKVCDVIDDFINNMDIEKLMNKYN